MPDRVIRVENISKKYIIGHRANGHRTLRDVLAGALSFRPLRNSQSETFWALKDVAFEVTQGEVVGIIGRNGAGKSTLLKILSRITEPTAGRVRIRGRVASLLEVGTGFHPELTGRENVFLNGAILGMSRAEINRKFDEIVAFAEVEKFLDTPVKRYSSGMYIRLAFAVAAHLEPEILIVDEVLAVGDAQFQKKCLGKLSDVAKEGRTVLFVSHNIGAVRKLCSRTILLDSGKVVSQGDTLEILGMYLGGFREHQNVFLVPPPEDSTISAQARKVTIQNGNCDPGALVQVGAAWEISVDFVVYRQLEHFIVAIGLNTMEDNWVRTSWSVARELQPGEYTATFREETVFFGSGRYRIAVGLSEYERTLHYVEDVGLLEIAPYSETLNPISITGAGTVLNPMEIKITSKSDPLKALVNL
ncbi:MAG: ABC transporter ATP-binding protein [Acidobacteria bacterium]|nr:MAG: ABC transporter ATP-binding protein [Acidobacteriota bacterium]